MPHYRKTLPVGTTQCATYPEYHISPGVAGVEQPRIFRYHAKTDRYCELLVRIYGNESGGYPYVPLYTGGSGRVAATRKMVAVHSLVALTFIGPRPAGLEVCHTESDVSLLLDPSFYAKDGSVRLRYDTHEANLEDSVRLGTSNYRGPEARERARASCAQGKSYAEIARREGVSTKTVARWVNGRSEREKFHLKKALKKIRASRRARVVLDPLP